MLVANWTRGRGRTTMTKEISRSCNSSTSPLPQKIPYLRRCHNSLNQLPDPRIRPNVGSMLRMLSPDLTISRFNEIKSIPFRPPNKVVRSCKITKVGTNNRQTIDRRNNIGD
ncbi:hypothetical protein C1H46_029497 [Malus baccata]|uniref:Uncharacterized protein n=1 Tax=Malus baccata TaxID=106549 RepID=A0A540LES8_MALBA|nr:hypothetical protein C1H46_029497 [Malus baccata]